MSEKVLYSKGGGSLASLMLFLIGVGFLLFACSKFSAQELASVPDFGLLAWLSLLWLMTFFTLTYLHYKSVYLIVSTYVLGLSVFHLGIIFNSMVTGQPVYWDPKVAPWIDRAGWLVLAALSSIGVGVALSTWFVKKKYISKDLAIARSKEALSFGYWSSLGLLLASTIFFLLAIQSYGNLLDYQRFEIFRSSADSRGFGAFMMIFPGAVLLFFLTATKPMHRRLAWALVFFSLLLFLFSGYRSAAMFPMLAGVVLWVKKGNKLPIYVAVVLAIAAIFAVSFFGYLRLMGSYGDIDKDALMQSYEQSSLGDVATLGRTVGLVGHTLRFVPHEEPYRLGRSYYNAVVDSVPNVGFQISSKRSRKQFKEDMQSDPNVVVDMAPSDWMTYKILRDQYDLGQGVGFSTVAEPYLNFGLAGVVVFFVSMGALLGLFDHKTLILHPKLLLFMGAMYWPLIRTVRNDFSNFIKPFTFMLVILLLWWIFSKLVLGKRLPRKMGRLR